MDVQSSTPPGPPPTAAAAQPVSTPLRVPGRTNLDKVVTIRGVSQTLRAHLAQIDASEPRHLKNGKTVTLQQVVDALDKLETKAQARLADTVKHLPMAATTRAKLAAAHADLEQERSLRRQMESGGWKELIAKTAGSARGFHPNSVTAPDATPPSSPAVAATQATGLPQPKSEPVDLIWQKSWGEPATAQVSVGLMAGNEFGYAQSSAMSGCAADGTASVTYLNGQPQQLARLLATATSTPKQLRGALRAYLLGQSQPIWSRDGVISLPRIERSYSSPSVGAPLPVIGPLVLNLSAQATGTFDVTASITPTVTPNSVACTAQVTPEVTATLTGSATLQLTGLDQEIMDVLVGSVNAGLNTHLTLLQLSLPSTLGLSVALDPQNARPASMSQTATSTFTAAMLQGGVDAFLNLDLDWWADAIAAIFDIQDGSYDFPLIEWPGESYSMALVNATNTIPFGG